MKDEDIDKVLPIPTFQWLDRLRQNHFVHLVKENELARIEFAYEPPNPGCVCGRIGIVRRTHIGRRQQTWFIDVNGKGIDGSQIMAPVEGNLPNEAAPISETWQRHIERRLDQTSTRMEQLERSLSRVADSCPMWKRS